MRGKWIAVTVGLGLLAFLTGVNGPPGFLLGWHPATGSPTPSGGQLPFFIVLSLLEALAFGFGVAFLLGATRGCGRGAGPERVDAGGAPVDRVDLDQLVGPRLVPRGQWPNLGGPLVIEYAFHVTLMLAGLLAALWFLTVIRQHRAAVRVRNGRFPPRLVEAPEARTYRSVSQAAGADGSPPNTVHVSVTSASVARQAWRYLGEAGGRGLITFLRHPEVLPHPQQRGPKARAPVPR